MSATTIIPFNDNDDDDDDNKIIRPSIILKNDTNNYDTASDESGYDENIDYKIVHMRRPSVIRETLTNFRKTFEKQHTLKTDTANTLISVSSKPSIAKQLKKKIFIPLIITISLITGLIIVI